jgi:hypothetical protein
MTELRVLQVPFARVPPPGPLQTLNHFGGVSAAVDKKHSLQGLMEDVAPRPVKSRERVESYEALKATVEAQERVIKEQHFIIEGLRRELINVRQTAKPKSPERSARVKEQPESSFFWNLERVQGNIQAALSKYS